MAREHLIIKEFNEIKGLDLRSSDLKRDPMAATEATNCLLRQTSALNKRPGYTRKAISSGGYGTSVFHNINLTTGAVTEEIVSVGSDLSKLDSGTFTITYSGANSATYSIFADGSQMQFYLYVDGVSVLNTALGTGSEASPVTITQLVAYIDALADFAASGTSSIPAAFLDVADTIALVASTPYTLTYRTWSTISTPTGFVNPVTSAQTAPFYNFYANRTDTGNENASIVEVNDVMYIATGLDELMKYDGTRLYRAGMPTGVTPSALVDGAGVLPNTTYYYKITYEYTDAKSNRIEGAISTYGSAATGAASKTINVTYTNLRHTYGTPPSSAANYKGYDTDSSNLKINIWRTKEAGTATSTYYLVTTIANNSASDTSVYNDNIADASLGAAYVTPSKTPGLPPKCKYLDVWRNMLIMSGCPTAVNTTYYADTGESGNEIFPSENAFDVDSKVTGLRSLDNVLGIFRERSIDGVTGDLYVDSFQVDHISRDGIGCASNASIQEINGTLYFLSLRGPYRISQQNGLENIGLPVSPKFQAGNPYSFKQATSFNWNDKFLYVLYMPVNTVDASYSSNSESETFIYDYQRGAWFIWTDLNIMGGAAQLSSGDIYISDRKTSETSILKMKSSRTKYDFSDHELPISLAFKSNWETVDVPSQYKKFLRIKIHSYDISINDFENDNFSLNLITHHDYLDQDITDLDLDFSGGSDGWGVGPWGDFAWGEIRLSQVRTKIASKKSKSMRVCYVNEELHENILISGWEIEVAAPYGADPIVA